MRKFFLLVLTLATITNPALAHVRHPKVPHSARHKKVHAPKLSDLQVKDKRFKETLPLQLSGPMERIAKAKYRPSKLP